MDVQELDRVCRRFSEAALDPALWPEVMEEASRAAGAIGAALFDSNGSGPAAPHTRSNGAVITPSLAEAAAIYFRDGWHARDPRAARGFRLALRGEVFIDQDLFTPGEMRSAELYNEYIYPVGLGWLAGIGFQVGSAWWALTLQRTLREGPFESDDKRLLGMLAAPLGNAATLSAAVGQAVITGMTDALGLVGRPALALDRSGCVLGWNEAADQIFDDEVRISQRRLVLRDENARRSVERLLQSFGPISEEASVRSAPITVQRSAKSPLVISALPVSAAARSPFLGARALLTISEIGPKPAPPEADLVRVFGLTPAEARLAALIGTGISPGDAAERLSVSRETARTQLKSILSKTDTHRQSALVALLSRLGPP
jgi:DNA-binding CsgD family transcriptional regulator